MGAQKMKDLEQILLNVLAFLGDKAGYPLYDIKPLESQKDGRVENMLHTITEV
jgi:hypothetical protein